MVSLTPTQRFVRCPKCLRVLEELPGITIYRCGGCNTILRAKIRPGSGDTLSLASFDSSSKNLSENSPLKNGFAAYGTHNVAKKQAVAEGVNVSDSNSGKNLITEFSGNPKNNITVCDSNQEIYEEKGNSLVHDENGIKVILLEQEMPRVSSSQTARNVDDANCKDENKQEDGTQANASCGGVNISSGISSEANGLMNSRDKLEECSEAERDMISAETRNGNSFRFSARCSHAYDSSASSTNEGQGVPQKYLLLSRRTFRNKKFSNFVSSESENDLKNSVNAGEQPVDQKFSTNLSFERSASANAAKSSFRLGVRARGQNSSFASEDFHSVKNWMESEKGSSPRSATEDIKRLLKFRYSKQDDRAKILSKIDELRDDLNGYFNKTADRIRSSRFTVNVRNFEGKVPPAQYRSSLVPFSKQSISSCLHCHPGGTCCHNDHCRPCPHNICCHLPKPANQPLETVPSRRDESHNFKRHCRPVSGGSPFVICYRCFKLLQLPADFLVSTKKVHKLRCGDCSQILLYTFRPKIQSEPETPAEAIHPPSEVGKVEHDCCGFSGDGVMDPVSYSEEYGLSFGKSFSYEANNEIVEEEDEDGRVGRLHLHKLMGYSSARQLLY